MGTGRHDHGFGAETTVDEVLDGIDLAGRRIAITGASSGLGARSALALAGRGAVVTMLARDEAKNAEAAERIREEAPDARLRLDVVDLSRFESIRAFAKRCAETHDGIDVLMNNAGVMACPHATTHDGFEMQFGTNHLGHFLLTGLLLPLLRHGADPRVVTLSSAAHTICDVDLDDYNFDETPYTPWEAYGRSKSANALFAYELAKRHGDWLTSVSVHPGAIQTALGRHLTDDLVNQAMERSRARNAEHGESGGLAFKSLDAGAATQVWAAVSPEAAAHNGRYLADCQAGEEGGNPSGHGFASHIADDETAARLWHLSERLTGIEF